MIEMLIHYGFFVSLAFFAAGAIGSLALGVGKKEKSSSVLAHACAALGGLTALASGIAILVSGQVLTVQLAAIGISPGALSLRIDALSAFFIAIIATVALAASIYGISYQKQFLGAYKLSQFGFFYNTFIASMLLVVTADNGLFFLFGWEIMSIASYFLVVFERRKEENVRAGTLYILISQVGVVCIMAALLLLYRFTGSWDFDTIRSGAAGIPMLFQHLILAFALVGFASKAGVIPLHIWLPEAHPAAPSHVSALMSGVMIKTAIFMIIRFFIEFFPAASASWGILILILGAISSLLGVLYALSEHDIKRLLAFHSVENIGIIFLGVGSAIVFFAYDMPLLGVLSLAAALFHTVNHALFKGLLFLSAGSVVHATHTRNMEEYGGLLKLMPWTGLFFLIGAVAISGIPPFNGFASEWLTFQGLFAGIATLPLVPKIAFLLGTASLACTGGLAAACFVKAFGATFLARGRSEEALHARESEPLIHAGMAILAALIVAFGLLAGSITPVLQHLAAGLRGLAEGPMPLVNPFSQVVLGDYSALSMPGIALLLAAGILAAILFTQVLSRRQKVVIVRTWDCGSPLTPRMEITATSFSRSLITIFQGLLRPTTQTDVEYHDETMVYFTKSKTVYVSLPDLYRIYLYNPVTHLIEQSASRARAIQTGNLNTYLLYMLTTLIILLYWALK